MTQQLVRHAAYAAKGIYGSIYVTMYWAVLLGRFRVEGDGGPFVSAPSRQPPRRTKIGFLAGGTLKKANSRQRSRLKQVTDSERSKSSKATRAGRVSQRKKPSTVALSYLPFCCTKARSKLSLARPGAEAQPESHLASGNGVPMCIR